MKIYLVFADGCDPLDYGIETYLIGVFSTLLEAERVMNLTKTQLKISRPDLFVDGCIKMMAVDLDTYYPLILETNAGQRSSFKNDNHVEFYNI